MDDVRFVSMMLPLPIGMVQHYWQGAYACPADTLRQNDVVLTL